MYRNAILTLVVLVGSAALLEAQPYSPRYQPPQQPSLQGVWYKDGDPMQPCSIQVGPSWHGASALIFTNETGDQSWGLLTPGGRVVAEDWGHLHGRVDRDGDAIFWTNGVVWRR